jgi:hypothetical protein
VTSLYRYYDRHGALLYVGISEDWELRLKNHQRYSEWFPYAYQLCLEHHRSRKSAQAAEREAIRSEWPLYNVHSSTRKTGPALKEAKVLRQIERRATMTFAPVPQPGTPEWEAYDREVWRQIRAVSAHRRHLVSTRITTYAGELACIGPP